MPQRLTQKGQHEPQGNQCANHPKSTVMPSPVCQVQQTDQAHEIFKMEIPDDARNF